MAAALFRTQENVDGWVLPDQIRTRFEQNTHNSVAVIVGSNADEMTSLGGLALVPKTADDYAKRIAKQFGELSGEFESVYGVNSEADRVDAFLGVARDTFATLNMRTWARLTVAAGSKAYLYWFSKYPPHPKRDELKAFHAGELPYVFDVLDAGDTREADFAYTGSDRRLADMMSAYWVNFVKTGDPNGAGLPNWTFYDRQTEPHLDFGETVRSGQHLMKAQLDFLEKIQRR